MSRRVPREVPELVEALRRHTSLLEEYCTRAFTDGDDRYLGEIAAKLRLLVYEHGRNRPLLIDLMDECGIECLITLDGPPWFELAPGVFGGDQVSIEPGSITLPTSRRPRQVSNYSSRTNR
jgi:hypothetical protein